MILNYSKTELNKTKQTGTVFTRVELVIVSAVHRTARAGVRVMMRLFSGSFDGCVDGEEDDE